MNNHKFNNQRLTTSHQQPATDNQQPETLIFAAAYETHRRNFSIVE